MKNKQQIITIILSVLISVAVMFGIMLLKKNPVASPVSDTPNSTNSNVQDVSMIQLIANPEQYHGQLVRVIGVGNLEYEDNCISLSKEDLKYEAGNSIWIELGPKAISYENARQYNGEYVIVEGVFDKDNCGHMGMFFGAITEISRYELWDEYKYYEPLEMYTVSANSDGTYTYTITDKNGTVLYAQENAVREPDVEKVNSYILSITEQAGTGLSTNWAVFCDVENSKVSEIFHYVLMAQGDYVVYVNRENDQHCIIVQNIFDKSKYYKEHKLTDCASTAGDVVIDAKPNGEGVAVVTYLTGDTFEETQFVIQFP